MRSYTGVFWLLVTLFTSLSIVNATTSITPIDSEFIEAPGGQFTLDGRLLRYSGTNAHWLQLLNKTVLNKTMHNFSALGIKVVRTWAFNDVTEIPNKDGVWFQVFHTNGTIQINEGKNGLVRLDNIVKAAKDNNLHVVFSLTNNWSHNATGMTVCDSKHKRPKQGNSTITPVDRRYLPRNFLMNDYGGMDVYNNHFGRKRENVTDIFHDEFYTDSDIVDAYSRYVATIVKRYTHETTVLGWELANDPRCSSCLPASKGCTPQTITKWAATIAAVVKQNDPNHPVSVGDGGSYCVDCPKLSSQVPTSKRSYETKPLHEINPPYETCQKEPCQKEDQRAGYLTEADLHRSFAKRATRRLGVHGSQHKSHYRQTRGHWYAARDAVRKRQSNTFGPNDSGSTTGGTASGSTAGSANSTDSNSNSFGPNDSGSAAEGTTSGSTAGSANSTESNSNTFGPNGDGSSSGSSGSAGGSTTSD